MFLKFNGCTKSGNYLQKCRVSRDALTKLPIEKGVITKAEFMQKLSAERAGYQAMLEKIGEVLEG